MRVVYIAGPFRAASKFVPGVQDMFEVQKNVMRAMELAVEVWRTGLAVASCPHSNTMFFTGAAPDHVWLEGDLELLRRSDALLLTPDWEKSSGARAEKVEADTLSIPVFYTIETLKTWLEAQ